MVEVISWSHLMDVSRIPDTEKTAGEEINELRAEMAEAYALLDLIDAEFRSDPMSVQCFDLRIVERVKLWVAKQKQSLAADQAAL